MPAYALGPRDLWTKAQRRSALAKLVAATLPGMAREEAFVHLEAYRASEAALFVALLSRYVRACYAYWSNRDIIGSSNHFDITRVYVDLCS